MKGGGQVFFLYPGLHDLARHLGPGNPLTRQEVRIRRKDGAINQYRLLKNSGVRRSGTLHLLQAFVVSGFHEPPLGLL